jgi:hypothetical protein
MATPKKKATKKKAAKARPHRSEMKCSVAGCKRPYRAKGYCVVHYQKWRRGELAHPRYNTCSGEGCRKPATQGGMCAEHWAAAHQKGAASAA